MRNAGEGGTHPSCIAMPWTLNSPAVWSLLKDRGWSDDDYAAWLAETLLRTVLHE
jgi:hypothetical protein